jgi:hypothetical protein
MEDRKTDRKRPTRRFGTASSKRLVGTQMLQDALPHCIPSPHAMSPLVQADVPGLGQAQLQRSLSVSDVLGQKLQQILIGYVLWIGPVVCSE